MKPIVAIIAILACIPCRAAEPIRILAWNIESGGSDTAIIIQQLKTEMPKFDIVALSEVPSNAIEPIAKALGWKHFGGSRGGEDRLMIAWSDRFQTSVFEAYEVGSDIYPDNKNPHFIGGGFSDRESDLSFILFSNHVNRGKEDSPPNLKRGTFDPDSQAFNVAALAEDAEEPWDNMIAVGNHNTYYDFHTKKGNAAFNRFVKDYNWKWIEPKELIDTNWSDPDGDGEDNCPNSILDFVFVNQVAWMSWKVSCEIVVRKDDFPDNKKTSDHRPVLTTIELK